MIKILSRIVFIAVFFALVFFAIIKGMANYYADERNHEASFDELKQAIEWNPKQAYALEKVAKHYLEEKDFKKAEVFAFRALANNLSSGLSTSLLIELADQKKSDQFANEAVNYTRQLWPASTIARNRVVKHWLEEDRVDKILPEWNVILSQDPQLSSTLFPIMFQLSQLPTGLILFEPYAKKPSTWWAHFFTYLTQQKNNLDSLQRLYQVRLESEEPLSNSERRSYIERLIKEKQWTAAYFGWLSGLEKMQQQYSQPKIYDGGFESDLNNTGFDWYYSSNKITSVRPDITRGMHGKYALHVEFKKRERINFRHVSQRLLLPAGHYVIKMRSRVDRLRTNKGLKWRIRCLGDQKNIIGEGRSFLGLAPWKNDSFYFSVPDSENCQAQLLRLEATSPYAYNHLFLGSLWFDDFKIIKEKNPKKVESESTSSVDVKNNDKELIK